MTASYSQVTLHGSWVAAVLCKKLDCKNGNGSISAAVSVKYNKFLPCMLLDFFLWCCQHTAVAISTISLVPNKCSKIAEFWHPLAMSLHSFHSHSTIISVKSGILGSQRNLFLVWQECVKSKTLFCVCWKKKKIMWKSVRKHPIVCTNVDLFVMCGCGNSREKDYDWHVRRVELYVTGACQWKVPILSNAVIRPRLSTSDVYKFAH